jgi:5-formyltetrahydrofolate cyclo-ligase
MVSNGQVPGSYEILLLESFGSQVIFPSYITGMDHKSSVRERVFSELRKVAFPDSRFHYDFGEFITDFEGSERAIDALMGHRFYRGARILFITPDNCLEQLRYRTLLDGKMILMTTYSIKRGFWLLDPARIPRDKLLYAATLDGMERVGEPISLTAIRERFKAIDYMITGTGAINEEGIRFGKGHGFFDAEWGMLYRIGAITSATPAAAVVHDCQVLSETLYPEVFDTVADVIFTPTRLIEVAQPHKPTCGIVWSLLDPHMLETIPPLQELRDIEAALPAME